MKASLPFAAILAAVGCTNTGLHRNEGPPPPPPKEVITVQGTFCTEDPETIKFPVKIWFVIDDSGSMATEDPNQARYTAAITLANQLQDPDQTNPSMFFGANKFKDNGAQPITIAPNLFTPVAATFAAAIQAAMNQAGGGTPYSEALKSTLATLTADISVDPVLARRTRYVVIFLSDGAPNGPGDPGEILPTVDLLMDLRDRAGDVTVNTVFLGGAQGAEQVLMAMAQAGNGIYKSFPNGDALDYSDFDFSSIRRNYNQRFFLVSNLNSLPSTRGGQIDSDADGLADYRETVIGSDPTKIDTDADGCRDLHEVRDAGWDPIVPGNQNGQCACTQAQKTTDTDKDGLNDCEEKWIASSQEHPDTDKNEDDTIIGDLVWDSLDFTYLGDTLFPNDGMDYDADGVQDLAELRVHTEPHGSDDARDTWAYDYVYLDQKPEEPRCYDFRVDNVSIMRTLETATHPAGENEILLYYAQSPQDNAQKEKSFRLARVKVNYSNLGTVNVVPEDFTEMLIANPPTP